jgi:hypothetical protein
MNADIKGMYNYYIKERRPCHCLTADDGRAVSNKLAKAYIKYCYEKGYKDLKSCPDITLVINELKY